MCRIIYICAVFLLLVSGPVTYADGIKLDYIESIKCELDGFNMIPSMSALPLINKRNQHLMETSKNGSMDNRLFTDVGLNIDQQVQTSSERQIFTVTSVPAAIDYKSKPDFGLWKKIEIDGGPVGDPVPEPATILLLGSGLVAIAAAARRKLLGKDLEEF